MTIAHSIRRWWWKTFFRPRSGKCWDCGKVLTAAEREYYRIRCEICEGINFHAQGGETMPESAAFMRGLRRSIAAVPWDASQIKPPGWDHVFAAFVEGAREARANPEATEDDFRRAADGHTKRVFEEVDPVSEAALRTESWRAAAVLAADQLQEDGNAHS